MKKQLSPSTKIAAFLFLATGITLLISPIIYFWLTKTGYDYRGSKEIIDQLKIMKAGGGILNIIIGALLMMGIRSGYIIGLMLVIVGLGIEPFINNEGAQYYKFVLAAIILILLIIGRKDFAKKKEEK